LSCVHSFAGGTWSIPVTGAIFGVSWYLFKKRIPEHEAISASSEKLPTTREIILSASAQYASLLFSVISTSLVALIVINRLGRVANALYYLPALIASGPALLLWNLVTSSSWRRPLSPKRCAITRT
jgi:hypothetical protein